MALESHQKKQTMKIKLFCFPFAGGSQYSYTLFNRYLPAKIELIPLDIPGRGARFSEKLLDDLNAIAEDLYEQIKDQLDAPFAFYGHSMGTMLCFLVTQILHNKQLPLPTHLFLSGRGGPKYEEKDRNWHLLPPNEFRQKLLALGGSPKEVLEEERLMELIEPILRADFKAVELFSYPNFQMLDIPVVVMIGKEEQITREEALSWQEITTLPVQFHEFQGDHFFIFEHTQKMIEIVAQQLISQNV